MYTDVRIHYLWLSSLRAYSIRPRVRFLCVQLCTAEADFSFSGSGSGSSNGSSDPYQMPSLLHFQTYSTTSPVRMNYAWSTVGFPTLFLSQNFDAKDCSDVSINKKEFINYQTYGSVDIPGADSNVSIAVVFHRLIQYDGGGRFKAANGFNPSMSIPDQNVTQYRSVYLNESIEWEYRPEDQAIVGTSSDVGTLTFKVCFLK